MVAEQIERMKRQYTDKYVVVDAEQPELARFRDTVGRVKTVNMNGQVLVEFDDYHLNIGWYDIDPSYLKLIDAPLPPKPKEAPAKAPVAKKSSGAAASAAAKPAAKPKPAADKPSTADILAKLRGGAGAAKPAAAAPAEKATKPATPKPAAAPTAAPAGKVDRSKMSVADMLAAARAGGAKGAAPAPPAQPQAEPEPEPAEEAAEEISASEPTAAGGDTAEPVTKPSGEKPDKKSMTIDQMLAWCREHDTK